MNAGGASHPVPRLVYAGTMAAAHGEALQTIRRQVTEIVRLVGVKESRNLPKGTARWARRQRVFDSRFEMCRTGLWAYWRHEFSVVVSNFVAL